MPKGENNTVDDPLVVQDPISTLSTVRILVVRYYESVLRFVDVSGSIGSESASDL